MASTPESTNRFAFLDALRGLAAISIVGYHILRYEPDPKSAAAILPMPVEIWWRYGWVGVQLLLVISGFVIAYSFRDGGVTWRSVGNFLVRRVVRLSPPYLVTLLFVLGLHWFATTTVGWFPSPLDEAPTTGQILSHLVYAQDIAGYPTLSAGLWTVCIEMQFYLLFAAALIAISWLRPSAADGRATSSAGMMAGLLAPLAMFSLFFWCEQTQLEQWVIYFFGLFFLGLMTWWTLDGRVPRGWYWMTVSVFVARLMWQWKPEVMLGLAASLMIYLVGRSGHLHDWLNVRWLQYLGRVSYSLYLIHYAVAHVVTRVGWSLCGGSPSPGLAALWLMLAMAASLSAAHLLYVWVEAPSARLAAHLKLRSPAASFQPPMEVTTPPSSLLCEKTSLGASELRPAPTAST